MRPAAARREVASLLSGEHAGIRWLATPPDRTVTDGSATLWQLHIPVPADHLWAVCPEERFKEGLPMAAVWPVRPRAADLLGWPRGAGPEAWFTTMARSRPHARQLAAQVCGAVAAVMPGAISREDVAGLLALRSPRVREWVMTQVLPTCGPTEAPPDAMVDESRAR